MYKVIEGFVDLKDNNHVYKVGDKFPHDGREVSESRINELSGTNNKRKVALIAEVEVKKAVPKPVVEAKVEDVFINPPVEAEEVQSQTEDEAKPTTRRSRKK